MSIKHVREYYQKVCDDYVDMLQTLTDMEDAFNQNMVSEEQVEQIKKLIEPLKNNYMTLSWIIFLLDKPQRDSKSGMYERQKSKFKSKLDEKRSKDFVLKENQEVIDKLKKFSV